MYDMHDGLNTTNRPTVKCFFLCECMYVCNFYKI